MPTVLQVLPRLEGVGGVERETLDISRALTAAGWRSIIVSEGKTDRVAATEAGGRHAALPVARRDSLQALGASRRLARLAAEEGVDLVHARSRWPAWLAYYAARRTGRPFVTTFHGAYSAGWPGKRRYNAIMTRGDRVIAVSAFIARHIAETYAVEPGRIRTIPRGVDLAAFDPARVDSGRIAALRAAWQVPEGRPVVMLPGRLTALKGHLTLLDALARIETSVCCVLVGDSDPRHTGYRARIEQRIKTLGAGHTVLLAGPCHDMPAAYMLADIVVSPSLRPEAFGRVPVEAQAVGRPVIAFAHGGALETVCDGETGWLVPPGDADALTHAIRQALRAHPAERGRMAAAGQAHVRRNFSLDDMCRATLDVYRELLPTSS
ncbi:MAG: glycosyltransferase family 4 protein [Rhodospirillaceae bacterium]|nr:glycosyltransferase family 4 protein [Rhodospirillaceae bacterium]